MYCINLDTSQDRWDVVSKEFRKYNILDLVHRVSGETKYEKCEANVVSVHLDIIRKAKQDKLKSVLIFEDDVEFLTRVWTGKKFVESDPAVYLRKVVSQLKDVKWDMLYLGWRLPLKLVGIGRNRLFEEFIRYKQFSNNLFQSACQTTGHAYIVNHTIYDKILTNNPLEECINSNGLALDHFYGYWLAFKATCINVTPMIATQRTCYSIQKREMVDNSNWTNKMMKTFPFIYEDNAKKFIKTDSR